jgi:hypothetical protein
MSEWSVVNVEFNEEAVLVEALKCMGYQPKTHKEAVDIKGYGSHASKKAHIVVSKGQFGGYTDCGFERTKTGFSIHLDNMDHKKFKVGKLKQHYSEAKVMKVVKGRARFSVKKRVEEEGKIKIRLTRNF